MIHIIDPSIRILLSFLTCVLIEEFITDFFRYINSSDRESYTRTPVKKKKKKRKKNNKKKINK